MSFVLLPPLSRHFSLRKILFFWVSIGKMPPHVLPKKVPPGADRPSAPPPFARYCTIVLEKLEIRLPSTVIMRCGNAHDDGIIGCRKQPGKTASMLQVIPSEHTLNNNYRDEYRNECSSMEKDFDEKETRNNTVRNVFRTCRLSYWLSAKPSGSHITSD